MQVHNLIYLTDIPAAVSLPHFYRSDPSLIAGVEGLNPDPKKHGSEVVLQPVSTYAANPEFKSLKHIILTIFYQRFSNWVYRCEFIRAYR